MPFWTRESFKGFPIYYPRGNADDPSLSILCLLFKTRNPKSKANNDAGSQAITVS